MVIKRIKAAIGRVQERAEQSLERDQELVRLLSGGKRPSPGSPLAGKQRSLDRRQAFLLTTRRALNRLGIK
jgi:hypothetical protein